MDIGAVQPSLLVECLRTTSSNNVSDLSREKFQNKAQLTNCDKYEKFPTGLTPWRSSGHSVGQNNQNTL